MTYNKKQLIIFLSVTFGLGWLMQAIAVILYNNSSIMGFRAVLAVTMFAPIVGVLASRAPIKEMGWKPKLKGKIRFLLTAWFAPFLLTLAGAALYFLIFPTAFDLSGEYLNVSTGQEDALAQLEAQGMTYKTYLIVNIISSLLYAPWLNMLFSIGEEAGWRGMLYPMLRNRFGRLYGAIIGGLIWGLWHFPVIALAGYEYGTGYFGAPVLGIFVFCIFTVSTGIIFDYLYIRTKCIWIPALAHGSINAISTLTVAVLDLGYMDNMILGPAPNGLISGVPVVIAALLVIMNDNKKIFPKSPELTKKKNTKRSENKTDLHSPSSSEEKTETVIPSDQVQNEKPSEAPVKPFDIVRENEEKAAKKAGSSTGKKSYPKSKGKGKKGKKNKRR